MKSLKEFCFIAFLREDEIRVKKTIFCKLIFQLKGVKVNISNIPNSYI